MYMNIHTRFIILPIIVTRFTTQWFTTSELLNNELEIQSLPGIHLLHLRTHFLQHCLPLVDASIFK